MSLVGFKSNNHPQQTGARGARDDVDDRGTRWDEFNPISERFGGFTLDVAAAPHNAKCDEFYTIEDDGLQQPWYGRVWCNPPYSNLFDWVGKAWKEMQQPYHAPEVIVMLVPANRTEQKWWQVLVENQRRRGELTVEFLPGRMRFDRPNVEIGPKGDRPPFGCALLIWQRVADGMSELDECTHEITHMGMCAACGAAWTGDDFGWEAPRAPLGCQNRGWYHDGSEQEHARQQGRPPRPCPHHSEGGAA